MSFFEKQKLTGPNFIDWYRQLRLVLSIEDKENYLEHPIPAAPVAPPGQQVPPAALAAHAVWVKGQKEVVVLMLLTIDLEIQRNLAHLGAYDMLQELKAMYSKQAEQELLQTVREFHTSKQKEGQSVSSHVLKMKGYIENLEQLGQPVGQNLAGLRGSKKLKPGALSLGKYMSQEFLDHLNKHGIIAYRTPPYTPQHNGMSERRNQTLLDMVRYMMSQTTLPKSFWDYALETATHILNMVPTKKVDKTPYEIWHGIPKGNDGYSFNSPSENKVFVARNAKFFESKLLDLKISRSVEDLELIQKEDTNPSVGTSLDHEKDDQEIDKPQSDINPIRKSSRTRRVQDRMCLYIDAEEHELGDLSEPANYKAALIPPNARTVRSKWLFKKKTDMDGAVYIFKARLVAKGFTQTYGIDYEETFSPVADIRAIRILIAIAAYYDYKIWKMDVKTAFLNGHLFEEVYIEQPEGFVNPKYPNHVCKLKRSIYGLKQASRQWNKRFDDEIKKFGFTQNPDEPCVYIKASGSYICKTHMKYTVKIKIFTSIKS
nr:retrotransposon protein, putative, Ty1-copia subclass [Tanacetum cinerariifolium]